MVMQIREMDSTHDTMTMFLIHQKGKRSLGHVFRASVHIWHLCMCVHRARIFPDSQFTVDASSNLPFKLHISPLSQKTRNMMLDQVE